VVYLGWDNQKQPGTASFALRCSAICQLVPHNGGLAPAGRSVLTFALGDINESAAPVDLTVEVRDRSGNAARLPLSRYAFVQPRIAAPLFKAAWLSGRPTSEVVLQTFEFPLAQFASANPAFDPAALVEVRLIFDRTPAGLLVLDDWGFRSK
jgi:hypothetical protein